MYLYVKRHNVTGLKYFGQTKNDDPVRYTGSGTYWIRHCNKHGWNISTEIVKMYKLDQYEEAKEYAINFSRENNIVESDEWANLKEETLIGGWDHINNSENRKMYTEKMMKTFEEFSEEKKLEINKKKARHGSDNGMYGRDRSGVNNPRFGCHIEEETKLKISDANKGKIVVKDSITNEIIGLIDMNHPKILSNEWVSINSGRKHSAEIRAAKSRKNKEIGLKPPSPKGLLWWTDGVISVRSKTSPGPSFRRGRIRNW